MSKFGKICAILVVSLAAARLSASTAWPAASVATTVALGPATESPKHFEASGIVWHSGTNKFYVVSDSRIASMSKTGTDVTYARVVTTVKEKTTDEAGAEKEIDKEVGVDMEGIAATGSASLVYVGVEYDEAAKAPVIRELQVPAMTLSGKAWTLPFPAGAITSGKGMEGLTWIPNGSHPYADGKSGGLFYASSQKNGTIYIFDVDLGGTAVSLVDSFTPLAHQHDIADLNFDSPTRILYVLYDDANQLVEIDTSTKDYEKPITWDLPATPIDQEGVALVPGCPGATTSIVLASDAEDAGVSFLSKFNLWCATAFDPTGDATITEGKKSKDTNSGSQVTLSAGTSPDTENFLIKFNDPVNWTRVIRSRLLLYATNGAKSAPGFCTVSSTWNPSTITWTTASAYTCSTPQGGGKLAEADSWVSYDVLAKRSIPSSSYRFSNPSKDKFVANSSEAASQRPYLLEWIQVPQ